MERSFFTLFFRSIVVFLCSYRNVLTRHSAEFTRFFYIKEYTPSDCSHNNTAQKIIRDHKPRNIFDKVGSYIHSSYCKINRVDDEKD